MINNITHQELYDDDLSEWELRTLIVLRILLDTAHPNSLERAQADYKPMR